MHRHILAGAALALALASAPHAARAEPFSFVALGDMPYTLPDDYPRFERLIGAVNRARPAFTVHVGDIKSGSTFCTDEIFQKVKDQFGLFEQPLVYTPGDNEWTDCHRERAGKFDPLERLAKVRAMFFEGAQSLGRTTLPLERQADLMPEHQEFVENRRWRRDGIVFVTVHVVGSNNGFERNPAMVAEYFRRDAANVAWLKDTFAKATAEGARGVVVVQQADMVFGPPADFAYANSGFRNTLGALAAGAEAFGRPVLLVQGDSHRLLIDQPLPGTDGKTALQNVTRLQVMGEDKVHGVRVLVDPDDPAVFGFFPLVVPENLPQLAKAG